MRIDDLDLPEWFARSVRSQGIDVLYPPQVDAIEKGLLKGENLVIATPTASGKTLMASITALKHLGEGRRVLYMTPFKALTSEKYRDFEDLFGREGGFRLIASTSDYDDPGYRLRSSDMIIATYEKADSLMRHGFPWFKEVGLVVADEVHLIGDPERGPTLEMVLSKLRSMNENVQILCLSATVRNAEELAEWLGGRVVISDFRPVPLVEGVLLKRGNRLLMADDTTKDLRLSSDPLISAAGEFIADGGQVLIFALTRRKAEQMAQKLATSREFISLIEYDLENRLAELSDQIISVDPDSPHSERLARLVLRGVAYHHAGLSFHHRDLIEGAYRSRMLPVICATPTLAAGVNLPARAVLIPEVRRYDVSTGFSSISVMEYKQFCGRAGRPRYDKVGYAVTFANDEYDVERVFNHYIRGKLERVVSCLGELKHLRSQVLSIIASGLIDSGRELEKVLNKTLFVHQFGSKQIMDKVDEVIEFLVDNEMVVIRGGLRVTPFGRRVSELYIDPQTAVIIKKFIEGAERWTEEGLLQLVCVTPDVMELNVSKLGRGIVERYLAEHNNLLLIKIEGYDDIFEDYEVFLEAMKNWIVTREWINERPDREIYEDLKIEPGDFFVLRERAEWISYAAWQLSRILKGHNEVEAALRTLKERVKHGVRSELIELVMLPGIGRVRGRALWREGYRSLEDVRNSSLTDLAKVVGEKTAEKVMEFLRERSRGK
ncbi:MAG: DEAD/DEAH box helicase [Aigarchaeota archaeon]|nr:DEAD/DEAH box helicase [Aigarchaeota archaeon]MDW8092918.1 DEAD/DEAH box helicase [Nitrososphaerota archaeon]